MTIKWNKLRYLLSLPLVLVGLTVCVKEVRSVVVGRQTRVLGESTTSTAPTTGDLGRVLAETTVAHSLPDYVFSVNVPAQFTNTAKFSGLATFLQDISAPNVIYSLTAGKGVEISSGQTPTLTNTGVTSLQTKTGDLTLAAGDGITLDGLKISNSGIRSLSAGGGISVSGSEITNSDTGSSQSIFKTISVSGQSDVVADSNTDTLTLVGSGLAITSDAASDKITLTVDTPDYTLSGWTDDGTTVRLTTSTDSLGIGTTSPSTKLHVVGATTLAGAVTLGSATSDALTFTGRLANGTSILPNTDLGSDLGSSALRFNNLWVANINSNSSQSFSGQTTFSYAPTDTTITEASVIINPTTSAANGQLLGLAIAGYQKALIDEDGDIILGYSDATSAPASDYPLNIYGHSGTRVAYVDTSGNVSMGTGLSSSGALTITPNAGSNLNISLSTTGDLAVNTNQLYVDTSTGYVGIGTTSPGYKLDVTGTGHIGGILYLGTVQPGFNYISSPVGEMTTYSAGYNKTTAYGHRFIVDNAEYFRITPGTYLGTPAQENAIISLNGDTDTFWTHIAADTMSWYTAGSERFRIDSSGNFGIGTTSPTSKLHVSGAVTGKALAIFDETGDQNILTASASGTTRMVLTNAGNLGIGTTGPANTLDVYGTGYNDTLPAGGTGGVAMALSSGANHGLISNVALTGRYGFQFIPESANNTVGLRLIPYNFLGTNDSFFQSTAGASGYNYFEGYNGLGLVLGTGNATPVIFRPNRAEAMRILSNGNVGIGTTSPSALLHAVKNQDAQSDLRFDNSSNGTAASAIFDFRNGALETGDRVLMGATGTGYTAVTGWGDAGILATQSNLSGGLILNANAGGIKFETGGNGSANQRMVIDNSGNVGIGTTAPGTTLDVTGSFRTTGASGTMQASQWITAASYRVSSVTSLSNSSTELQVGNDSFWQSQSLYANGARFLTGTAAGNVGIGTTAPTGKLNVVSTTEQLRLGYDSSNYWSNTVGVSGGLTMQGVGTGGSLTLSPTSGQNLNISLATTGDMVVNTNDLVVDTSSGYIGINTTAPTALLDLAGTSGTDAFRLTNSGSKVLGLKYETNAVTFDQTSTDPTNKLLNSTFDSDLTSWSEVPSYTLNDQFTTDRAAGAVNGTSAEPTGGTRTVVDTENLLTISSSQLSFGKTGNNWNQALAYSGISRSAGKVFVGNFTQADFTKSSFPLAFGRNATGDFTSYTNLANGLFANGSQSLSAPGNGAIGPVVTSNLVNGTEYQIALILRSSGAYYYIKGGIYTNWALLWISSTDSTATIYPTVSNYNSTFTADNIRIPTSTWLPTPLAYDTFTRSDGAISSSETSGPDSQTTPSLAWTGGAISTNKNVITPTLGSELVTNGGFDSDTAWTKNGWTISGGVANPGASEATIQQPSILSSGNWYQASYDVVWVNHNFQSTYGGASYGPTRTTTGSYLETARSVGTYWGMWNGGVTNSLDNVSVKALTLSSLFSSVSTSDADVIADANVTLTAGTQAGLVLNLDSTSSPANFIIVYHDGTSVKVDEAVAGVYTNKQTTTVTYSAGATLRAIREGTKLRVYYNNALVGSELTMTANTNTKHGLFSTYSGNSFDNFTLWARGTGAEYTGAPFEELVATRNTTTKYNNSTASVQLVTSGTDANYLQSVNVGDTSTYNLIAYAYTDGSAVTSADLELYYDTAVLSTTYTAMGGTGWYKLTGSLTGVASAKDYGVRVKAGRTVYVDEMHLQVGTGTAQTMYVMNSNTGVTGLNVQGLINGTLNGVASYSKAGTISDTDFVTATDGLFGFDTTNHRLYFREGGSWSYIARTAGFQIPKEEVSGLSTGDYLMPYVESFMSDGAVHGLYQKFDLNKLLSTPGAVTFVSDVTFLGKTVFNKDTAGTAIISTYSNQVDVKFTNVYDVAPIVNMNLVVDATDSALIEEGQKAYLTNVTPQGFSIKLPILAPRDYVYNWIAIATGETNVTQSRSIIQEIFGEPTLTPTATPTPTPTVVLAEVLGATTSATPTAPQLGGQATPTPEMSLTPTP